MSHLTEISSMPDEYGILSRARTLHFYVKLCKLTVILTVEMCFNIQQHLISDATTKVQGFR